MNITIFNSLDEERFVTDTLILKMCVCKRVFDPITGDCDRMPLEFVRPNWRASSQPCKHCDPQFYLLRSMRTIKDFEEENENGKLH